jgi:hypothetical protein
MEFIIYSWKNKLKWSLHCHKIAPTKLTELGGQNVDKTHGKMHKNFKKLCEKSGAP